MGWSSTKLKWDGMGRDEVVWFSMGMGWYGRRGGMGMMWYGMEWCGTVGGGGMGWVMWNGVMWGGFRDGRGGVGVGWYWVCGV